MNTDKDKQLIFAGLFIILSIIFFQLIRVILDQVIARGTSDEDNSINMIDLPSYDKVKSLNRVQEEEQKGTETDLNKTREEKFTSLINEYFEPFNGKVIDQLYFDEMCREAANEWKSRGASVIVQIINGTIYVDKYIFKSYFPWDKLRFHHVLARLQVILQKKTTTCLPNMQFILNTHDCPMRSVSYGPVFSITRCKGIANIPLPQWYAWRDGHFNNWNVKLKNIIQNGEMGEWEGKLERAIFRGNVRASVLQYNQTTERLHFVNITEDNMDRLGRTAIYLHSLQQSDYLDVGLFGKGLAGSSADIIKILGPLYQFKSPINMLEQAARFKYVIYAEGACGWADRLRPLLASGMLILMQVTPCNEFFTPLLTPWIHYVPLKNDFSDLIEQIQWARDNDSRVRQIIKNASIFVQEYLSIEWWDYYIEMVLRRYSGLMADPLGIVPRKGSKIFKKETSCPNLRNYYCNDTDSFQ